MKLVIRYLPLILKNSLRNRRRSLLTVLSIAASFCLLGVLMAMYHMFFFAPISETQALRLITRHRVSITNSLPLSYRERIRAVKGVREVCVLQYFGGTYKDSRELKNFFARFAVEPEKLFTLFPEYHIPDEQKQTFQRERSSCVVGRGLAQRLGFKLGDRITLVGDIFPVTLEFTVSGIYDSTRDNENLFFHYAYLRESLPSRRQDFVGLFDIMADSPESVPRIMHEIDAMFRNSPWQTKTESERTFELSFLQYLGNVKLFLLSICGALTFTVLLVSANTMAMSVRERVREVGILKTLGYTPHGILSIILGESVIIALFGGALGLGLARGVVEALRQLPSLFVDLKGLSVPVPVSAAAMLLAVLVGISSSAIPAWTTSRRPIVECLRFTG